MNGDLLFRHSLKRRGVTDEGEKRGKTNSNLICDKNIHDYIQADSPLLMYYFAVAYVIRFVT